MYFYVCDPVDNIKNRMVMAMAVVIDKPVLIGYLPISNSLTCHRRVFRRASIYQGTRCAWLYL